MTTRQKTNGQMQKSEIKISYFDFYANETYFKLGKHHLRLFLKKRGYKIIDLWALMISL